MKDTLTCSNCSHENPIQAKFCENCGKKLARACPTCSTTNKEDAKFCLNCGEALQPSTPTSKESRLSELQQSAPEGLQQKMLDARSEAVGTRKPVTIMFTDIVGSTAIAEKLDPEDWREIVAGAHQVICKAIYRFEGTITQLLGDGVYALFGAPLTHEDDPERACLAALDALEAIGEYRLDLAEQIEDFQIRVGIHTGDVVIGDIGTDLHVEYLAFGDAVNLASRLEGAAEPGSVLVSMETHKHISPAFKTEALGPIQLKGKEEPIEVYRVLAPKTRPRKLRGIEGLESKMVGREDEIDALLQMLERLKAGDGGITTIVGEAGIGKSRLVAECRADASQENLDWIEGRCLSYGGSIPYLLWLDAFQTFFGLREGGDLAQPSIKMREKIMTICGDRTPDVYPYLGRLLSLPLDEDVTASLEKLEGGDLKSRIFHAVETVLECAALEMPTVFICEDLHWADPSSLELLEFLLPLTERVPLVVMCVHRPEKEHGSWKLREAISSGYADRHVNLELAGLTERESEALVDNLVGLECMPSNLRDRILRRAEGIPFYVEEFLRSLKDTGVLTQEEETTNWTVVGEPEKNEIPDTLHGVLLSRIDRLQEDTKRVLQMASVIGRIFLYKVLSAIAEMERELDGHLEILEDEEMVRERARLPELEYIFKHNLTQEAAYNTVLKRERRRYHKMVAQSLEQLFPERMEEILGVLAHHWERANDPEKAVFYLQRAGDQARMAYALREAIDNYKRALDIQKEQEEFEQAARTLMKLGLTYYTAFDFKQSRQAYQEAFEIRQEERLIHPNSLPKAPHPFRIIWPEVPPLDPPRIPTYESRFFIKNMFSGLVNLGVNGEIIPDVAQSWEISEDGRRYVFHLREDEHWSDGQRVTAEDFVYSFRKLLDPGIEAYEARELFIIRNAKEFNQGEITEFGKVGVRALNSGTLEVDLCSPASHFLYFLANIFPIPKHVVEALGISWAGWETIVTNGPFQPGSFQSDETILLVRNSNYHRHFPSNLDEVQINVMKYLPEESGEMGQYLEMYRADSIDLLQIGSEIAHTRHQHAEEYNSEQIPGLYFFAFDASQSPFKDKNVRKAFAFALDKEKMATEVPDALLSPADGGFLPPGIPGHSPEIGLSFDPFKARQLLAEAGYPGGVGFPPVEFAWVRENDALKNLINQWRDNLNVDISFEVLDYQKAIHEIRKRKIFFIGWRASVLDPDNFLRVCIREGFPSWRNETYDRLIEAASNTLDQRERIQLYQAADKFLIEEALVIPIEYAHAHYLVKPWVKIPPGQIEEWELKDVIIEPH